MNRFVSIITAIVSLFSVSVFSVTAAPVQDASPNFSWGRDYPAAQVYLEKSRKNWDTATAPIVNTRSKDKPQYLDENYLYEVLKRDDFMDNSPVILDLAMRRERSLSESQAYYAKAVASVPKLKTIEAYQTSFTQICYYHRSMFRLVVGAARTGVSKRMALPDTSAYCSQAMEAGIDALRDAANYAERADKQKNKSEQIRKFRAALFAVWEESQKTKQVTLIKDFDILKAFNDAFPEISVVKKQDMENKDASKENKP